MAQQNETMSTIASLAKRTDAAVVRTEEFVKELSRLREKVVGKAVGGIMMDIRPEVEKRSARYNQLESDNQKLKKEIAISNKLVSDYTARIRREELQLKGGLKITGLDLDVVYIDLVQPYHVSDGVFNGFTNSIVRISTNCDIIGYGEADPLKLFSNESNETVVATTKNQFSKLLLGKNPLDIDALEKAIDAEVSDANVMAKAMINIALWDIYGKYHNKPVYQCLANDDPSKVVNKSVPLLYPFSDQTIEKDLEMTAKKLKEGYRSIMLKMGANKDIDYEIKRVHAFEEFLIKEGHGKVGENVFLIVDPNQGWSYEDTVKFVEGIKPVKLASLEQPLPKNAHDDLLKIQTHLDYPLTLDESVQSSAAVDEMIKRKIGSMFSLKVTKNGGISKLHNICDLCSANQVLCYFNSMAEFGISQAASLSVIAVTSNIIPRIGHCYMSTLRFKDDITNFRSLVKDAVVTLSDKPGLGIELNLEKLKKYSIEHYHFE